MALSEMNYVESKPAQIDYDYVKSVVDSHTHTYDWQEYNNTCTLNEGGIYYDSTNKIYYAYADFTIATTTTPVSWNGLLKASPTVANILPNNANSTANPIVNIGSTTATNSPVFNLYVYSSSTYIGATKKYTTGERHKVYAVWTKN